LFFFSSFSGTLSNDSFKYYVIQDALYLDDFADCLRRLAASAGNEEDAKRLNDFSIGAEEAEKSLHNSFFVEWNISADGAKQMPNTCLYTSYMKRVVTTRSHKQGLAALLPCFWVYMEVGKCMMKLRDELGEDCKRPPQFDAWIDMYGGDEFEKEVKDYIALVDADCKDATEDELKEMQEHFNMCCKLEHMFWDQATERMEWPMIGGI
jgi:thiaminase/transcriptional activator TenA